MKTPIYILLTVCFLIACGTPTRMQRYTPFEEQRLAHDYLMQGNKADVDDHTHRMILFDKATYHLANIVVRDDANDTLRADALYTLRWIEAYIKHDYELALQYLNQYIELVGPKHESYPTCLAYKADDLWHFGAQDSALHYAYRALEAPHTPNDAIEYICHHILWNIYDSREMPDSASRHKALYIRVRDSRVFEPMTMDELKSQLHTKVIAPTIKRDTTRPMMVITIVIATILYIAYRIVKRHHPTSSMPIETSTTPTSFTEAQRLHRALTEGYHIFESISLYRDIATMQINERELPDINYETTRTIEHTLLDTFNGACRVLLDNCDLNDQDLVCCLCIYLGYSNTITAHLGHTTTATIRKRKERIRKKLSADLYEILVGENE